MELTEKLMSPWRALPKNGNVGNVIQCGAKGTAADASIKESVTEHCVMLHCERVRSRVQSSDITRP